MGCNLKASGFTLLEVLIALAILAIVMIGLIKITAANVRNLRHLENKTLAHIIADNHATLLKLSLERPENQDGWETMAGRKWYWQIKRPVIPSDGVWNYRISVYLEGDSEPYAEMFSAVSEKPNNQN